MEQHESIVLPVITSIETCLESITEKRLFPCRFHKIENGILMFEAQCQSDHGKSFSIPVSKEFILFAFCPEGKALIRTSLSEEKHFLDPKNSFLFSNPYKEWEIWITLEKKTEFQFIAITIERLHSFFGLFMESTNGNLKEYLKGFRMVSYYSEKPSMPVIKVCIHQLFQASGLHGVSKTFFQKSKILEFLALYMNRPENNDKDESNCPYIIDGLQEERIRQAQRILQEKMTQPPTIRELAKLVGTNEFKLKADFRYIFGETIYRHLLRHRMETARHLFDHKKMQVQEVAERVGYSNTSHFITAFKKQFGVTPKKYLLAN